MFIAICSVILSVLYAEVPDSHDPLPTQTLKLSDAVILGLVEGATEFLPISSTGHLILTRTALGLDREPPEQENEIGLSDGKTDRVQSFKDAVDAYIIIIQVGAIAAVLVLYWPRVRLIALGAIGRSRAGWRLGLRLAIALIPAVVLALAFETIINRYLFNPYSVAFALGLGALVMLGIERRRQKATCISDSPATGPLPPTLDSLSIAQALLIGLCQAAALWPGMSRSMAALVGGYLVGLKPREAAEFSFLLGLPTLAGAACYESVQRGPQVIAALGWLPLWMGGITAMAAAAVTVRVMVSCLERYGLVPFAWYRLGLALLVIMIQVIGI